MIRQSLNTIHDRWAELHRFVRFLLLIALLAIAGLGVVRPTLSAIRDWRTAQNLSAAKAAVKNLRMVEARDRSLSVLQTGDPSIDALRIFETATASLRDPRHGQAARALINHPEGSDADRLTGFRGLADQVAMGLVGQVWAALPQQCQNDPRFALVFADRLIAENHFSEAAAVLSVLPDASLDEAVNLRLIRVLIGSGKRQALDEASRLIAESFPSHGTDASPWLKLLESLPAPAFQNPALQPLRAKLTSRRSPDREWREFMLVRIDYATQWTTRGKIIEQAIQHWRERNPLLLARWLDDLGLYQRLIEVFPADQILVHPKLLPHLLKAATLTGQWDHLIHLIDQQKDLLPPYEELAHRAIGLAKTTARAKPASDAWNEAINQAATSQDPGALLALHRIATQAGMPDEADLAMVEAIRSARGPLPLYRDQKPLLGRLAARNRENLLIEVCSNYLLFEPANPVLLTQYAYLACMTGIIASEEILKAMEPLAAAFPDELPIKMVIIAAHLAAGNPTAAGELLAPLELTPESLAPAYQAIVIATELLTGKRTKTDPAIRQFPRSNLLPSERRRFTEWTRLAES